jgi:hypothetical protein
MAFVIITIIFFAKVSFLQSKTQDFSKYWKSICKKEKLMQIALFWNILFRKSSFFALIESKFRFSNKMCLKKLKKINFFFTKKTLEISHFPPKDIK